jgi:hypothetical protein
MQVVDWQGGGSNCLGAVSALPRLQPLCCAHCNLFVMLVNWVNRVVLGVLQWRGEGIYLLLPPARSSQLIW